jgi:prepilin-type N-terminal cleavage/methylation domain-containing protein
MQSSSLQAIVCLWCCDIRHADGMTTKFFFLQGFTLIESLLSAALMAILMGIALPNFEQHWQISRRQDAQNSLLQLHLKQLQWRSTPTACQTWDGPAMQAALAITACIFKMQTLNRTNCMPWPSACKRGTSSAQQ